jgi:hypothetical protein
MICDKTFPNFPLTLLPVSLLVAPFYRQGQFPAGQENTGKQNSDSSFFLSFFDKPQSAVLEQGRGSSFLRLHSHTNAFDPLIQPFPDFPRPYLPDSKIIRLDIPITLFTYRVYYILILIEISVSTLILKT